MSRVRYNLAKPRGWNATLRAARLDPGFRRDDECPVAN